MIRFDVGQGTQDIGFRNDVTITFDAAKAAFVALNLKDEDLPGLEKMLRLPAGRLGTPTDLGAAALFLLSAASEWVTGQNIRISGGG